MEFIDENVSAAPYRINSKKTSASARKSSKKALLEVVNVIHSKNFANISPFKKSEKYQSGDISQSKQSVKSKEDLLMKMDNDFFTCGECQDSKHDEDFNIIPEDLHFTDKQVFEFATQWSNCILPEFTDLGPLDDVDCIHLNESFSYVGSSYLNLLDESFDLPLLALPPIDD